MSNKMKLSIISTLLALVMGLSLLTGCIPPLSTTTTTTTNITTNTINNDLINEAYKLIKDNYVTPDKTDGTTLTQGAIRGMVAGLNDRYDAYLTPEQYQLTTSDFAGSFEGIGASVGLDSNGIVAVIAPIPNSPAAEAGIKAGDEILAVDGKSTEGMTVQDVVLLIRGPKDTTVTLSILHKGDTEPVTLTITRDTIQTASVIFEMKGDYAYIHITEFTETTGDEMTPVYTAIKNNNAKGIIIDLRQNPGGYLTTVVDIASHFITQGTIVSVIETNGNQTSYSANRLVSKFDQPMVVLVDQYSASGSEVLSGALQDYKRAIIAGQVTYGKGSVNELFKLSDGSGIYLTIARWATPNGHLIEEKGITPDIPVDWTKVDGVQWAIDYLNGLK